jgi:hypothetical protein
MARIPEAELEPMKREVSVLARVKAVNRALVLAVDERQAQAKAIHQRAARPAHARRPARARDQEPVARTPPERAAPAGAGIEGRRRVLAQIRKKP